MFRATQLLTILALMAISQAQSFIDDFDTATLRYSVSPSTQVKWGPFGGNIGEHLSLAEPDGKMFSVNDAACFDGTFFVIAITDAACHTSDLCSVTIPFTGSGATVFVLQAGSQGINVSVTVDGGSPTIRTLAPIPPPSQRPKVPLFDVQSLSSGAHSLTVNVLDWNGIFSGMMLDYIAISQTPVTAPQPLPPPPPPPSPPPSAPQATTAPPAATTQAATSPTGPAAATSAGPVSVSTVTTSSGFAQVTSARPEVAPLTESTPSTSSSGYAAVTSAGFASSPSGTTITARSQSHVGVIAGGILGGLAIICITIALFFCKRLRQKKRYDDVDYSTTQQFDENGLASTMHQGGIISPYPAGTSASWTSPQSGLVRSNMMVSTSSVNLNNSTSPASWASPQSGLAHTNTINSSTTLNFSNNPTSPTSSAPSDAMSGVSSAGSRPPKLAAESASTVAAVRATPPSSTVPEPQVGETRLTDEQADFVNNLYRRNIPASAIALITERMLNGGGMSEEGLETQTQYEDVAPPSYDLHNT